MKVAPLSDLAEKIDYGVTASASTVEVGPKFLRITDIQDGEVDWNQVPFCEAKNGAVAKSRLAAGDIVFARTGATTGKSYRIHSCPADAVFASYLIRVRPGDRVDSGYLARFFQSPQYWRQLAAKAVGAAQPGVNASKLGELLIPYPPLAEQKRIAAILDQADDLLRTRQRCQQRLRSYPAALLDELVGFRGFPPVNVRPNVPEPAPGSRWVTLTDVARLATGHTPDRKVDSYWGGTIPWISLADIRALDGCTATATTESVTEEGIANSSSVVLPRGTVCLARTASVGFVTMMGDSMATSQDFVNWVCGPEVEPIYLMFALIASRKELRALAPGSTHKTIYFPTVQSFKLLLPPIEIQRGFAEAIRRFWAAQDCMGDELKRLRTLFYSLQDRAFRGEL